MASATIPGYPRIGKHREMKKALEAFWAGKIDEDDLQQAAIDTRHAAWEIQAGAGLDLLLERLAAPCESRAPRKIELEPRLVIRDSTPG